MFIDLCAILVLNGALCVVESLTAFILRRYSKRIARGSGATRRERDILRRLEASYLTPEVESRRQPEPGEWR